MIFETWRLTRRLKQAEARIRKDQFDEAQTLLVSVLNRQPEQRMVYLAYSRLVVTEFHRSNLRNALHYAKLCGEDAQVYPEFWEDSANRECLDRVQWYRDQCEESLGDRHAGKASVSSRDSQDE